MLTHLISFGWDPHLLFGRFFRGFTMCDIVASKLQWALKSLSVVPSTDKKTGYSVTDLCSGNGEAVEIIQKKLTEQGVNVNFTLTDLYPDLANFQELSNKNNHIHYTSEPIDATNCDIQGFRTLFASFHHFDPPLATKILADAVHKNQGIAIFEVTKNNIWYLIRVAILTGALAFLAPLLTRPVSLQRFFWTYYIPVIPFFLVFDGIMSNLRTYSKEEMVGLIAAADPNQDFDWRIEEAWVDVLPFAIPCLTEHILTLCLTCLIGLPKEKPH